MAIQLKTINTNDRVLQQIQDSVQSAISQLAYAPFQNGSLLASQTLTSGQDNLIPHGLARVPQIWVICGQNTSTTVWSPASADLGNANATSNYLNLRCGTSCTVSIWVA